MRQQIGQRIGFGTNNQAEYRAALAGLEAALALGATAVDLRLDSELIVRQVQGRYRVHNAALRPLFERLRELSGRFERFHIRHVRRELNREADALANAALDGRATDGP